ncbi:MAG: hypothetical protein SVM80_00460 [Halobacteriota archaeon]|nr:hypothetical protein [Halobacteriota archaeon]
MSEEYEMKIRLLNEIMELHQMVAESVDSENKNKRILGFFAG